jgi:hypothetical protein
MMNALCMEKSRFFFNFQNCGVLSRILSAQLSQVVVGVEAKRKHHQICLNKLYNFAVERKDVSLRLTISFQIFDFHFLKIDLLLLEYLHRCKKVLR